MGLSSSLCLAFASLNILSKLVWFHLAVANSVQSYTPTCHDDEHSALLQFKQSFVINKSASYDEGAYPKVSLWKPNSNCCSWDGVECDVETGRVIGLDLSSSCLYGSISSNNSLFHLVRLQRLNLADNDFIESEVPTSIRNFPRLRYLNLSLSLFSGHVPSEVSQLSKLTSLDLSRNSGMFSNEELLRSLAQNLTGLETLDFSSIAISSTVPHTLSNLSHLTSLRFYDCALFGEFPGRIFKSQNLKVLDVSSNPTLTGYFPADDHNGSGPDLISLKLSYTNISINLTSLIEWLPSLKELGVSSCSISEGPIPFSLGNLRDLIYLDLSDNKLIGQIPAAVLGNLTQLTYMLFSNNSLQGPIPFSLGNLRDLIYLDLSDNKFNGQIPAAVLGNLTQLTHLSLYGNSLHGPVPESLFNLINIHTLVLGHNNLSGTVELQRFLNLQKLTSLDLSNNNLELLTESTSMTNATSVLPKFRILGLGGCNIREFPNFIRSQDSLIWLNLFGNKLRGRVPKWMWNTSTQTLRYLNISHNFLSGFDQPPAVLLWVNLQYLDLSFNMLGGSLLIPSLASRFMFYYAISNNQITGQVPQLICNLTSLQYLDLSNNMLTGILPQCLGDFGYYLQYLNLGNNSFYSNLPEAYTNGSWLRMVDISRNNFHGQLPRSLANCASLETLVLSHNKFTDTFPVWLGALTRLKILMVDNNGLFGVIVKPNKKDLQFPVLRILYLSSNNFSGQFPFEYIFSGNGTTSVTHDLEDEYIFLPLSGRYFSVTIISKGVEMYYPKIRQDLILIDISSNNFEGKIPEFIGKLKEIWSLNISNNTFTGSIPSSLGNLSRLESLDLSYNKFSGVIPQQLAKLDFLAKFNVSYNNLRGHVPHGNHFTTFDSTSYLGNPRLCGDSLPTKCGDPETLGVPSSRVEESDSEYGGIEVSWKFALAGVLSGLMVGVVLADVAITRWPEWFSMIVGMLIRQMKRRRGTTVGQKSGLMKRRPRN